VVQRSMTGPAKASLLESFSLPSDAIKIWDLIQPNRNSLKKLKRISIRNRSWFRMLNWAQRRFIDAIIMVTERVRSLLVLRILAPLVRKLLVAVEGDARRGALVLMVEGAYKIVKIIAEKIVQIAQRWGNKSALKWLDDSFIRYLIVMNLPQNKNSPLHTF